MIIGVYSAEKNNWFVAPSWRAAKKFIRAFGMPSKLYKGKIKQIANIFNRLGISNLMLDWARKVYYGINLYYMYPPEKTFTTEFVCINCGYVGTWIDRVSEDDGFGGTEEMRTTECYKCNKYNTYRKQ